LALHRAHAAAPNSSTKKLANAYTSKLDSPANGFSIAEHSMNFLKRLSGMRLVNTLLGGWTGLVLLFLYLPILLLILYSFNDSKYSVVWEGFTLKWYDQLATDFSKHMSDERRSPLIGSLNNSLIIAAITTVLSVVLGTAGAWLLYRYKFPALRSITTLIYIPMIIPEIIMGISLLIFFKTIDVPLGFLTVIISHVTFCFPFVLIAVQARLAGVDPSLEEAAMDLGAPPIKAFFLVMVPYLLPAIISGALMSFTLSMDEVIVTYFTRGPTSETLPIRVFGLAKVGLSPMLNTISAVFIAGTALLVVISESVKKWNK
jgi:spermidine/putrescine transport system permease protein